MHERLSNALASGAVTSRVPIAEPATATFGRAAQPVAGVPQGIPVRGTGGLAAQLALAAPEAGHDVGLDRGAELGERAHHREGPRCTEPGRW
jgi:hypothetical protein